MGKIKVLDCTLRDGGYVNEWRFGKEAIRDIYRCNVQTGVDVVELGFLRDLGSVDPECALYSSPDQLGMVVPKRMGEVRHAVMAEMACYYPWEKIIPRSEATFDMIRYSFWKRCLDEGLDYAKKIRRQGYDLGVQPTRVEQYSDAEFEDMLRRFQELEPYAIYIVDTFGLLTRDQLLRYAEIADRCLEKDIVLGYHAHNNMQQAFCNASAFAEMGLDRTVMLDVSAFGMGRGAGNLNSEVFLNYLNQKHGGHYDIDRIYEMWDLWLRDIYETRKWGYSFYYQISARYRGNPNYATYFIDNGFSVSEANRIMGRIPYEERIRFSEDTVKKYMERGQ